MSVTSEKLFPITRKDIAEVRDLYGKTESSITTDLEIIRNWLKKQPHLPEKHDDSRLERILLRNKFRLEQTKVKLDKYFSLRAKHPEYFDEMFNPERNIFNKVIPTFIIAPMPKLTSKMERLLMMQVTGERLEDYRLQDALSFLMLLSELQISYDYAIGERIVMDFTNFTMGHLKTFTLTLLETATKLYEEAFSGRIISAHFINAPTFLNIVMTMLKQALPRKLYYKIHIHEKEELYKFIPKECLPSDYGGEQRSMKEIHDDLCKFMKLKWDYLEELANTVSNEKLRLGDVPANDQFGVEGTFKNLLLD